MGLSADKIQRISLEHQAIDASGAMSSKFTLQLEGGRQISVNLFLGKTKNDEEVDLSALQASDLYRAQVIDKIVDLINKFPAGSLNIDMVSKTVNNDASKPGRFKRPEVTNSLIAIKNCVDQALHRQEKEKPLDRTEDKNFEHLLKAISKFDSGIQEGMQQVVETKEESGRRTAEYTQLGNDAKDRQGALFSAQLQTLPALIAQVSHANTELARLTKELQEKVLINEGSAYESKKLLQVANPMGSIVTSMESIGIILGFVKNLKIEAAAHLKHLEATLLKETRQLYDTEKLKVEGFAKKEESKLSAISDMKQILKCIDQYYNELETQQEAFGGKIRSLFLNGLKAAVISSHQLDRKMDIPFFKDIQKSAGTISTSFFHDEFKDELLENGRVIKVRNREETPFYGTIESAVYAFLNSQRVTIAFSVLLTAQDVLAIKEILKKEVQEDWHKYDIGSLRAGIKLEDSQMDEIKTRLMLAHMQEALKDLTVVQIIDHPLFHALLQLKEQFKQSLQTNHSSFRGVVIENAALKAEKEFYHEIYNGLLAFEQLPIVNDSSMKKISIDIDDFLNSAQGKELSEESQKHLADIKNLSLQIVAPNADVKSTLRKLSEEMEGFNKEYASKMTKAKDEMDALVQSLSDVLRPRDMTTTAIQAVSEDVSASIASTRMAIETLQAQMQNLLDNN